jgi:hypothetical protein
MHLRSIMLAGATALAMAGFAHADNMGTGTIAPPPVPPNTAPTSSTAAPMPTTSLDNVQSPKTTLAGAKVQDAKGEAIGEVKTVTLDASGKVAAVNVEVGGTLVTLKADTLAYAQANNTLISTQTRTEIGAP